MINECVEEERKEVIHKTDLRITKERIIEILEVNFVLISNHTRENIEKIDDMKVCRIRYYK